MNILHVVNIYFVLPYFIGEQFDYFHEKGHTMHVICSPSEYLADYAREHHFQYQEVSILREFSIAKDIQSITAICRYIRVHHIDIVEGHTPKGALLAMIAAKICGVPKRIFFRHGMVYETSTGLKRWLLQCSDKVTSWCATQIVCVSPSLLKKSIQDRLAPIEKQIILNNGTCNGIDTQGQFNPNNIVPHNLDMLRNQLGISPSDFVVGYTGRMVRDKGIIELIEAFDLLTCTNKKLLLVGMFEQRDSLSQKLQQRILTDPAIIYTGYVNKNMEYYYALMDVYVLASYREGFPTGVLEAQSMGIPVVTTTATGCIDSIIEGKTGTFTDHTPTNIVTAIERAIHIQDIDTNGRQWVTENFDNKIIWKKIEQLYF